MNLRRLLAEIGLGKRQSVREYRFSYKRRSVVLHVFLKYDEFLWAMQQFSGVRSGLRGRYMFRDNMPRIGPQGFIAIPAKYLSVEVLAHEWMHLCCASARKNKEETAVIMASSMLAETLSQLKRDGFKVPLRNEGS